MELKKSRICVLCLLLLFIGFFSAHAQQNLVPNPGFEELKTEELKEEGISDNITYWHEVSEGEIGYVHPKSPRVKPDGNDYGQQEPLNGKGYIWMKMGGLSIGGSLTNRIGDIKRYYVQTKLTEPLKAGLTYHVKFFVSLADKSNLALDQIGVYFSKKALKRERGEFINDVIPQVKSPEGEILADSTNWMEVSGDFVAKGGEEYMVIGNFALQYKLNYTKFDRTSHFWEAYYFIDDVVLTHPEDVEAVLAGQTFEEGKSIVLEHVLFKTGSAELLESSFSELNRLAEAMREKSSMNIEVGGHTDNTGTEVLNLRISEQRAKTVQDYLLEQGITKERITIKGYGSSKPIADNATDEGRRKNRRVELMVLK